MTDDTFTPEERAEAKRLVKEVNKAISGQLREFLFGPVDVSVLADRVAEAMAPFFEELQAKQAAKIRDYIKIDPKQQFTPDQGVLMLTIDPRLFEGWPAGVLREMNHEVPDNIPDCATLQVDENGKVYFDWVELEFTLEKNEQDRTDVPAG